jgi:hypothetical protein
MGRSWIAWSMIVLDGLDFGVLGVLETGTLVLRRTYR